MRRVSEWVVAAAVAATACAAPGGSATGPAAPPIQISHSGRGAFEAALTILDDRPIAAWYDTRDGNGEIYLRALDSAGRTGDGERRLTIGREESYEPSLDRFGDSLAVAWYDKSPDGTLVPKLGRWRGDGTNVWVRTLAPIGRNAIVRAHDADTVFCAWIAPDGEAGEAVWASWWTSAGEPIGGPRRVAAASRTTWNLNATVTRGTLLQALVVFDAEIETHASELYLARITTDDSRVIRLTADDGEPSKYPDIAGTDDRLALTWYDARDGNEEVYLAVVRPGELASGLDLQARRITHTPGASIGAYAAWNRQRIGLAWSDNTAGQHDVYFQAFDRDGSSLGPARQVTNTSTESLIPAIVPWQEGFALAWNEYTAQDAHDQPGRSEIAFAVVR